MKKLAVRRMPWPPAFPEVVVHANLADRDSHPDFPAAKAGDKDAAARLAVSLTSARVWTQLNALAGSDAVLLPVAALETDGFNAIPDAMARVAAGWLKLDLSAGRVIQFNRVGHTRASGWHRLVTPPLFEGAIERGRNYILVDDHIGLGGTLANLRGHIEGKGGRVVAMTTLTESREARTIAVRAETLNVLRMTHGRQLEDLWQETFGHGLDCLTEVEAGYLARQLSVDLIRTRMAEAAEQARRRGVQAIAIDLTS